MRGGEIPVWSPVCTKNQAKHDHSAKQRKQDLVDLARIDT